MTAGRDASHGPRTVMGIGHAIEPAGTATDARRRYSSHESGLIVARHARAVAHGARRQGLNDLGGVGTVVWPHRGGRGESGWRGEEKGEVGAFGWGLAEVNGLCRCVQVQL